MSELKEQQQEKSAYQLALEEEERKVAELKKKKEEQQKKLQEKREKEKQRAEELKQRAQEKKEQDEKEGEFLAAIEEMEAKKVECLANAKELMTMGNMEAAEFQISIAEMLADTISFCKEFLTTWKSMNLMSDAFKVLGDFADSMHEITNFANPQFRKKLVKAIKAMRKAMLKQNKMLRDMRKAMKPMRFKGPKKRAYNDEQKKALEDRMSKLDSGTDGGSIPTGASSSSVSSGGGRSPGSSDGPGIL